MIVTYDYSAIQTPVMTSYAQEGEDIILCKLFSMGSNRVKRGGFYVDVGAHHPVRFSNTYLLHKLFGWRGVNIDPNPGFKALFDTQRPSDTNLELGISSLTGELDFHLFDDPALNTLNSDYVELIKTWNTRKYLGIRKIRVDTLAGVFDKYVEDRSVDLLNVDVEGHDFEVLKSGDWERYRPRAVLLECLELELDNLADKALHRFMQKVGYTLYAKTCSTLIYREQKWPGRQEAQTVPAICPGRGKDLERPTLSVVFATMNRLEHLQRTVASLRRELDGKYSYEIVVVDGRSIDGSLEYLKTVDTVRVLQEDIPHGCCFAFDMGLRAARGDWVCWLNDDIEVTPGAIDKMFAFMTSPDNANVGIGAFPNSRSREALEEFVIRGFGDYPVIYADFGFMRRSLLEQVDFLDLRFRKYGWDPDLSLRVWERGLRVTPCEGANIVHFFAEDGARQFGSGNIAEDCRYLQVKWEERRHNGLFYKIFSDTDYRDLTLRLIAGWPGLNLRLHCGEFIGLSEKALALYQSNHSESSSNYYRFGLELMKSRKFAEAYRVFRQLDRDAAPDDPMWVWYRYKCGESLLGMGSSCEARKCFRQTAATGHVMSRLRLIEDSRLLRVVIGADNMEGEERIYIPLKIQDPFEWDYYFAVRPANDVLLVLSGTEMGLDCRVLARMLDTHLAEGGNLAIRPLDRIKPAHRQAELLAEELSGRGFIVSSGLDGEWLASRIKRTELGK